MMRAVAARQASSVQSIGKIDVYVLVTWPQQIADFKMYRASCGSLSLRSRACDTSASMIRTVAASQASSALAIGKIDVYVLVTWP